LFASILKMILPTVVSPWWMHSFLLPFYFLIISPFLILFFVCENDMNACASEPLRSYAPDKIIHVHISISKYVVLRK
jgi:hypothetical protein